MRGKCEGVYGSTVCMQANGLPNWIIYMLQLALMTLQQL